MTFNARNRINPAVNLMLVQVISPVRKVTLGNVAEFIAWLDILPVGVTVGTERFMMTGTAGLAGQRGIKAMLGHKIGGAVIEGAP
jgi:hypothetical protein